MVILVITKSDLSPYWTEHFNDLASCNRWLAEEQTRPYWDKTYISTITDLTPPDPTPAEVAALAAKRAATAARVAKITAAKGKGVNFTPQEVQDILKVIVEDLF